MVDRIIVDAELLRHKLERGAKTLARVPRARRDSRYEMLESRRKNLARDVAKTPLPKRAVDLAAEITIFEADAAAELQKASEAAPKPAPPAPPAPDETPAITDTSTT